MVAEPEELHGVELVWGRNGVHRFRDGVELSVESLLLHRVAVHRVQLQRSGLVELVQEPQVLRKAERQGLGF